MPAGMNGQGRLLRPHGNVAAPALAIMAAATQSACAPATADLPAECVAASEGGGGETDGSIAPKPSGFFAQQWFSSETRPYQLNATDEIWFRCPLPIRYKLDRQRDLPITAPGGGAPTVINVDPGVAYQTILGTGDSMEEASVSNLLALSSAKRNELLTGLIDPVRGMGLNVFRLTMGTSDFTGRPWYTYDDLAPGEVDPDMTRFSIEKDLDYGIVSVVKEMYSINPNLLFFASPWSPPGWMKTSGQASGGLLLSEYIPALAKYFRKFVEAYRAQGIPIYAVTLQNEPRNGTPSMPSCIVSAEQEAMLVQAIKREFALGQLNTKAWVFDQNFDVGVTYAQTLFGEPGAYDATDAVAFHDYAGDPGAMSVLHDLYPNKDIVFTEKTLWGVFGVDRAAQYFRNWSRTYVSWLTMLDQNGRPNNGPTPLRPRRVMRSITYTGDEYYVTPEHYLFGLYSKFVRPGARRIASDYGSPDTVTNVAFINPDGTVVVVVINQTSKGQEFALLSGGNQAWADLPAKTAASYLWQAGLATSDAPPAAPPPEGM